MIKRNLVLNEALENFHCGERFKELCIIHKRESPTEWAKILGLSSRNQVYYRWENKSIEIKELLIICDQLNISIQDFFQSSPEISVASEPQQEYKKVYIEDQVDSLERRLSKIEVLMNQSAHKI